MDTLSVANQLEWWVYGFVFASVICSVGLMIRIFRRVGGGGDHEV